MMRGIVQQIKIALLLLILFSILTGLLYPALITGIAQACFPWQANGSLIKQDGKKVGSLLIGQAFSDPKYFWGRPSATTPFPYNAANSSGSNKGPSNQIYLANIENRVIEIKKADPGNASLIPVDLVTASGSGLDPDISPLAAFYQVRRIASSRGVAATEIIQLIKDHIKKRTGGILGEPRVNVLELNLALDNLGMARTQYERTSTQSR
jgi:K+-transporting ATPase ATPase C chain